MSGYVLINLKNMLDEIGESEVKNILSDFYCPLNPDVELFLKQKAIEFSKQGISSTYLLMASYKSTYVLAGYFSLANKFMAIYKDSLPSKNWQRRISKFAQFDRDIKRYTLSAPLIGQLSKNYYNSYSSLITGDELLKMALDKVQQMQTIVGGKIVYLECEDKPELLDFYSQNGFVSFGKRSLDRDETISLDGEYLIQMLKYI